MKEKEKKLLLYNALDQIYKNNEVYEVFDFFTIENIYINDTYMSIEKETKVQISLGAEGITIDVNTATLQVRYEDLTNFSIWIEA